MTHPLPAFIFWLCGISGLLLIGLAIPLWLRRIPPNPLYGARFAATLADPQLWYAINARAGRDLVVLGTMYALLVAVIAVTPGWNTPAALLTVTGAWLVALISVTARLGRTADQLSTRDRMTSPSERLPNER